MNTCRICGKEIGKTYSDKKLRCSSCRKSVENAIGYNERTVEYVEDELFAWKEEYKKLKKEKENLKSERDNCLKEVKLCYNDIHSLEGQISNLEEENNRLKNNAMEDMRVQTKLEEEIKILKEENEKLKYNNKLYKEMIDKIQIAYIKFEEATDEKYKAFRKAYGDLDQVIMNR